MTLSTNEILLIIGGIIFAVGCGTSVAFGMVDKNKDNYNTIYNLGWASIIAFGILGFMLMVVYGMLSMNYKKELKQAVSQCEKNLSETATRCAAAVASSIASKPIEY